MFYHPITSLHMDNLCCTQNKRSSDGRKAHSGHHGRPMTISLRPLSTQTRAFHKSWKANMAFYTRIDGLQALRRSYPRQHYRDTPALPQKLQTPQCDHKVFRMPPLATQFDMKILRHKTWRILYINSLNCKCHSIDVLGRLHSSHSTKPHHTRLLLY